MPESCFKKTFLSDDLRHSEANSKMKMNGVPENARRWEKYHCTAGFQLYKL